jgi:hypothetical protein
MSETDLDDLIAKHIAPETELEGFMVLNEDLRVGLDYGFPRDGHPEGKVILHVGAVLKNIDEFYGGDGERSLLRTIGIVHDSFKYHGRALGQPHGVLAREFAKDYIDDERVLEVLEKHDEGHKLWKKWAKEHRWREAEDDARTLIGELRSSGAMELFLHFYDCDNNVEGKDRRHYKWFKGLVERH